MGTKSFLAFFCIVPNRGSYRRESCARHGFRDIIMSNNTKDFDCRKTIEEIIGNTFRAIQDVYNYQTETAPKLDNPNRLGLSRIVFPKQRKEPIRISEQELRFIFVEQLNMKIREGWDVFYSVETPTCDTYSGFSNRESPQRDDNGRSGEFDLVVFNNQLKRIALVEFKANNASSHDHKKDFVKLDNVNEGDNDVLRYFIEIVKSYDNGTLSNLHSKIQGYETMFRCWSLDKGEDITYII